MIREDFDRTGAHLPRHSLATNMLRKGASLHEIGEMLGHRLCLFGAVTIRVMSLRWLSEIQPNLAVSCENGAVGIG